MSNERPGKKRLSMDIPEGIYELILRSAKDKNISVTRWILQTVVQRLKFEDQYK